MMVPQRCGSERPLKEESREGVQSCLGPGLCPSGQAFPLPIVTLITVTVRLKLSPLLFFFPPE